MRIEEKLHKLFNSENSIILQNVVRRINDEWERRIIWEHVQLPSNNFIKDCKWEGFTNVEDCINDCLKYLETLK